MLRYLKVNSSKKVFWRLNASGRFIKSHLMIRGNIWPVCQTKIPFVFMSRKPRKFTNARKLMRQAALMFAFKTPKTRHQNIFVPLPAMELWMCMKSSQKRIKLSWRKWKTLKYQRKQFHLMSRCFNRIGIFLIFKGFT